MVKNPPANAGDVRDMDLILGQGDPLEKGMATHSSILAWKIPRTAVLDTIVSIKINVPEAIHIYMYTHTNVVLPKAAYI